MCAMLEVAEATDRIRRAAAVGSVDDAIEKPMIAEQQKKRSWNGSRLHHLVPPRVHR